jgi:hypothetical protein
MDITDKCQEFIAQMWSENKFYEMWMFMLKSSLKNQAVTYFKLSNILQNDGYIVGYLVVIMGKSLIWLHWSCI